MGTYFPKTRNGISRRVTRAPAADGAFQFVYLLSACGYVKVGRAKDIDLRIRQLQGGCPEKITPVVAVGPIGTKMAHSVEKEIHGRMGLLRSCGEWFSCEIEPAVSLLALIGSSFVGSSFFVFNNEHDLVVSACLAREGKCRSGEDRETFCKEVESILSCFQNGSGVLTRRKNRTNPHTPEPLNESGVIPSRVLM